MVWRPNIASKADNPTLGEIKEFARQETFFCFLLLAIIIIYENEHGGNLDIFLIKIILAFVIGAVWITLATVIAEKFGTKIGGMVLGLPSTTAISLFFIAWTQSPSVAAEATTIIPIIMGINTLFILGYVFVSKFNFSGNRLEIKRKSTSKAITMLLQYLVTAEKACKSAKG